MNEAEVSRYITETFEGVDVVVAFGRQLLLLQPG